jgi:hypothetical protein
MRDMGNAAGVPVEPEQQVSIIILLMVIMLIALSRSVK